MLPLLPSGRVMVWFLCDSRSDSSGVLRVELIFGLSKKTHILFLSHHKI